MALAFPENLAGQIVTSIETSFTSGLTFVAPILVAVVGINLVRKIINRGKSGRI